MSQNDKDDCNCLACTIRRELERRSKADPNKSLKIEPWMEILNGEQLDETIEDAKTIGQKPSIDVAILTLTHALKQYSDLAVLAKTITNAMGKPDVPEFAADKRASLRRQLKSLIDIL